MVEGIRLQYFAVTSQTRLKRIETIDLIVQIIKKYFTSYYTNLTKDAAMLTSCTPV